jgi:hypothetical protein
VVLVFKPPIHHPLVGILDPTPPACLAVRAPPRAARGREFPRPPAPQNASSATPRVAPPYCSALPGPTPPPARTLAKASRHTWSNAGHSPQRTVEGPPRLQMQPPAVTPARARRAARWARRGRRPTPQTLSHNQVTSLALALALLELPTPPILISPAGTRRSRRHDGWCRSPPLHAIAGSASTPTKPSNWCVVSP